MHTIIKDCKIYRNRIIMYLLVIIFLLMTFILAAHAGVDGWTEYTDNIRVTEDENGRPVIEYHTNDKEKTSSIYYKTFAFDVADAYVDTNTGALVETGCGETRLVLNASYFQQVSEVRENGRVDSVWRMDYGQFLEMAKSTSPEWYARLQDPSQTAALKWDPVIAVCDPNKGDALDHWSAKILADGTIINNWGQMYTKADVELLANLYAWRDPNSIRGKYARGLIRQMSDGDIKALAEMLGLTDEELTDLVENPEPAVDPYIIGKKTNLNGIPGSSGDTAGDWPKYDTYNYSNKFNLGDAIPTSEDVTNGYNAEKWAGNAKVNFLSGAEHEYPFAGTITYVVREEPYTYYDNYEEDGVTGIGEPKTGTYKVWKTENYACEVVRAVDFWFIEWANFWDFIDATTENEVFPGGSHHYSSKYTVGATVKASGIDLTSEPAAELDIDEHVDWEGARKTKDKMIHVTVDGDAGAAMAAFKAEAESRIKPAEEIIIHNDTLEIDGTTYMNGADHPYGESKGHNKPGMAWSFSDIPEEAFGYVSHPAEENEEATGRIPYNIKNKEYYTSINTHYLSFIGTHLGTQPTLSKGGGGDPSGYITAGYEGNEPIRVHTPVVSPVKLGYTEGGAFHEASPSALPDKYKTQLVSAAYNSNADYQLLLDHTYTIKFDEKRHEEHVGYPEAYNTPILYNKYTKRKYVCFPFAVQINNKIYEPTPDDNEDVAYLTGNGPRKLKNYTPWIELYTDDDHHDDEGKNEDSVTFYIPPWATEGPDWRVYYMVVPENADRADFDMHREEEILNMSPPDDGSDHLYNYMATYSMECQLSGIIYDFRITGINDKDRYGGLKETPGGDAVSNGYGNGAQDYPFAIRKEEKAVGGKNRDGGTSMRYMVDGTVTNMWPAVNTLPLTTGSSRRYIHDGELIKGNEIAFNVRTIANLWDEEIDEMYIKVNFSYVPYAYDGTMGPEGPEPVDVYAAGTMKDSSGNEVWNEFILADSPQDRSYFHETSKGDEKFRGTFYTEDPTIPRTLWQEDDLVFSTDTANFLLYELKHPTISTWPQKVYEDTGVYLYKPSECSALGLIKMSSDLRLLTGNLEQLQQNLTRQGPTLDETGSGTGLLPILDTDEIGVYSAVKTNKPSGSDPGAKYWEKFRRSMQLWFGTYWIPNRLYVVDKDFDLHGYIDNKGYVDGTEDIFKKDGYLVINFDIYTKNDGQPHLRYYGVPGSNKKDQWKLEGGKTQTSVGDPTVGLSISVPLKSGDIAILDTGRSREDFFTIGTMIVN